MDSNQLNLKSFSDELIALKKDTIKNLSPYDYHYLKKIIWTNRFFLIVGYATAWLMPNPLSMLFIGMGMTGMWMVAHHVCHGGYNHVPNIPKRYTTRYFAEGWRRFIDWPDWMLPAAWKYEHNVLHHFHLNEKTDPDQMSYRLRTSELNILSVVPRWVAVAIIVLKTAIWKADYYAVNTLKALKEKEKFAQDGNFNGHYRKAMLHCYAPYLLVHFVLFPLPFLLLGTEAYVFVLINRLGAEFITNWQTFLLIVPNHTGGDLLLNHQHYKNKEEFYLAQILSSCNYATGGYWRDYFQGYLNYQIEHHLFPDLPPTQYMRLQPVVKKLCEKYNIPYVQERLSKRIPKLFGVMVQEKSMPLNEVLYGA